MGDNDAVIKGQEEIAEYMEARAQDQEPVEPTDMDVTPVTMEYRCGACGHLVGYESAVPGEVGYKYQTCPECGRRVKWGA